MSEKSSTEKIQELVEFANTADGIRKLKSWELDFIYGIEDWEEDELRPKQREKIDELYERYIGGE